MSNIIIPSPGGLTWKKTDTKRDYVVYGKERGLRPRRESHIARFAPRSSVGNPGSGFSLWVYRLEMGIFTRIPGTIDNYRDSR